MRSGESSEVAESAGATKGTATGAEDDVAGTEGIGAEAGTGAGVTAGAATGAGWAGSAVEVSRAGAATAGATTVSGGSSVVDAEAWVVSGTGATGFKSGLEDESITSGGAS